MRLTRTSSSMASASCIGGEAEVFHAVDLGRIDHAADVFAQPEDGRPERAWSSSGSPRIPSCHSSPRAKGRGWWRPPSG